MVAVIERQGKWTGWEYIIMVICAFVDLDSIVG